MARKSVLQRVYKGEEGEVMVGGGSRVSLGAVFLFGFLCFLFFGIVSHQATSLTTITVPSTGRGFKLLKSIGKQRQHGGHRDFDLNYVSKRRVPNGPDPIHNRRAGKSTQPPVRA